MALTLKVHIVEKDITETMLFDPATLVCDACKIIGEKFPEANQDKEYGMYFVDEKGAGVWLESNRNLSFMLRNHDVVEYRCKIRTLKVCILDGTLQTFMVEDSQRVSQLMIIICTKIGIMNHEEYSLIYELTEDGKENRQNYGTFALKKRKYGEKEKDMNKMGTNDESNWVDHSRTLQEQGIDETKVLLLRRKYFFSEQNIDHRDPVQLNLLYVQRRDAILSGTHPIAEMNSIELAGIQCQIKFGDHDDQKHKIGFLDLKELLPQGHLKSKGIEKKILAEHKKYGVSLGIGGRGELGAKVDYISLARSLKTYGVTFFLVKEKMKGRNKLVHQLLGVAKDTILKLDKKTKEILKTWPLTTVRRWAKTPNTFTLDFGDYSDQNYSVQTTEGEQISQLIAGYIDILLKRQQHVLDKSGIEGNDRLTFEEYNLETAKHLIIQHDGDTSSYQQIDVRSLSKPSNASSSK
ncbi:unnamed protein product, partial [Meganyctiphanes norvegica]